MTLPFRLVIIDLNGGDCMGKQGKLVRRGPEAIAKECYNKPLWTPEELTDVIDQFRLWCEAYDKAICVPSLCEYLKISKDTLQEYLKIPEYRDIIDRAYAVIESDIISKAMKGQQREIMSIFVLKSLHDYRDTQKVEVDNKIVLTYDADVSEIMEEL